MQPQRTPAPVVEIGDKQYALLRNILGGQTSIVWQAIPLQTDWTKDPLLGIQARDLLRSTSQQQYVWQGEPPAQYVAIKVARTDAEVEGLRQEARVLELFKDGIGYVQLIQDATEATALIPAPCLVLKWASGTQVDALQMPLSEIEISAFLFRIANALSNGRRRAPAIILTDTIKGSSMFWKWDESQQDGELTLMDLNRFANQDSDFRGKTLIRLGALVYILATSANFEIDIANDRVPLSDIGQLGKENWAKLSLGLRSLIIRLLTRDFSGQNSNEIVMALREDARLLFNWWRETDLLRDLSSKPLLEQVMQLDIAEKRGMVIPNGIDKPLLYAQVLSQYQTETRSILAGDFLHWMTNVSSPQQIAEALRLLKQTDPTTTAPNAPIQPLPELKTEQIAEGFLLRAGQIFEKSKTILETTGLTPEDREVFETRAAGLRLQALLDIEQAQRHAPQLELPEWVMALKREQVAYQLRKGQKALEKPETVAESVQIFMQALTHLPQDVDAQRAYGFAYALWQAQIAEVSHQPELQLFWLQIASNQQNLPEWAIVAHQQAKESLESLQKERYETPKAEIAQQLYAIIQTSKDAASTVDSTNEKIKGLLTHQDQIQAMNKSLEDLSKSINANNNQPNILQQITQDLQIAAILQAIAQANSIEDLEKLTIDDDNEVVKKAKQTRRQALQLNQKVQDVLSQQQQQQQQLEKMIEYLNSAKQTSETINKSINELGTAISPKLVTIKETIPHQQPRWWQHPATVAAFSSVTVFILCVLLYFTWLKPPIPTAVAQTATPTIQAQATPPTIPVDPTATTENQPATNEQPTESQLTWQQTDVHWEDAGNRAVFKGNLRNNSEQKISINLTMDGAEPCTGTVPPNELAPKEDKSICVQTTGTAPDYRAKSEINLKIDWDEDKYLDIPFRLEDFAVQPDAFPTEFALTELKGSGLPITLPSGNYLLQWFYAENPITSTSSITPTYQTTLTIESANIPIPWMPVANDTLASQQGKWKLVVYRQPTALQEPVITDTFKIAERTFSVYQTGFAVAFAPDKAPLDGLHTLVITNTSALTDTAILQLFLTNTIGYSATIGYADNTISPTKEITHSLGAGEFSQALELPPFAPGEQREIQIQVGKTGKKPTAAYLLSAQVQSKTSTSETESSQTQVIRIGFIKEKRNYSGIKCAEMWDCQIQENRRK